MSGTLISDPPSATDKNPTPKGTPTRPSSFAGRLVHIGRRVFNRGYLLAKTAHHFARRKGGWHRAPFVAVSRAYELIRTKGFSGALSRFRLFVAQVACSSSYRIPLSNQLSFEQAEQVHAVLDRRPLVSIVVPVYKVDPQWLELCIQSVANQYYSAWELILVDDGSQSPVLTDLMTGWSRRDERIRLVELEKNLNISAATNAGIEQARGEFIGFLDHDDELTPDALTWIVAALRTGEKTTVRCPLSPWGRGQGEGVGNKAVVFSPVLNNQPQAKWVYSDEAVIRPDGTCSNLHLKPDYSSAFLLSAMYTCHFSVYAAELVRSVGGMRLGFEGAQDHDLALRISERVQAHEVLHIPRVLYKWRAIESSTASDVDCKPQAVIAGRRAVEEALTRRGILGEVASSPHCPSMYQIHFKPKRQPAVSIIIPTKNGLSDLQTCLDSLRRNTKYPNYEVIVIDNQSDDPRLLAFLHEEACAGRLRVLPYQKPFNHSAMNNLAVRCCESEFVVFMNNDVELISEDWLETLVATAEWEDSIAGVGAKLLYPDDTVQHAGMILGICGLAGHAHRFAEDDDPGHLGRANLLNEFSGCTAALLLMRKSAFQAVGGFDEELFPTSFNDVDLWIRLQQAGYRCLFNPQVKAYHYESKSRETPHALEAEYENRLKQKWAAELANDPFYNPNLGLDNELFFNHRPYPMRIFYRKQGQLQVLDFSGEAARSQQEPASQTAPQKAA